MPFIQFSLQKRIKRLKRIYYSFLSNIVHSCNNQLAKGQGDFNNLRNKYYRFSGEMATLFLNFPNISTYTITHDSKKIIVVGDIFRAKIINRVLETEEYSEINDYGKSSVLKLPALVKEWLCGDTQLVVCALSPLYPLSFFVPYVISSPSLICQVFELPDQIDDLLEKPELRRIRRQIIRSQRFGFDVQFTQRDCDFNLYYWKMYVPYIQNRFGITAVLEPYEVQFEEFSRGGLILVTKDGEPVSGMLTRVLDDHCYYLNVGVLNANQFLLNQGLFSYNLWELIKWGHQQGAKWIDLGGSFAFQSDGVFQYKSNWGAKILSSRLVLKEIIYLMNNPSIELLELLNRKGIIHCHHGKFFQTHFVTDSLHELDDDIDQQLQIAKRNNLAGIVIVSPFSKRYVA